MKTTDGLMCIGRGGYRCFKTPQIYHDVLYAEADKAGKIEGKKIKVMADYYLSVGFDGNPMNYTESVSRGLQAILDRMPNPYD